MGVGLGLDPSVACSGYAFVDDNDKVLKLGKIETDAKLSEAERLDIIYREVMQLCKEMNPEYAVLEDQFVGKNPQTSLYLARARGVTMLACHHAGVPVIVLYTPGEIKKAMTGKGNAKKELVQEEAVKAYSHSTLVQEIFADGIKKSGKKKNDDISDALAAVYTHETKTKESGRSA